MKSKIEKETAHNDHYKAIFEPALGSPCREIGKCKKKDRERRCGWTLDLVPHNRMPQHEDARVWGMSKIRRKGLKRKTRFQPRGND